MAWIDDILSGIPANSVLRERLQLAQEQRVAAAAEAAALRSENDSLRRDNKKLELDSERLQKTVQALEQQISSRQGDRLPELQERLLLLMAESWLNAPTVAASEGLNEQVVQHHLEELKALHMVELRGDLDDNLDDQDWRLNAEGRKYLVTRGLLA